MKADTAAAGSLKGQVALVTGAGTGAGQKIAETLAFAGASIAANDFTPMNVGAVVESIRSRGGIATTYVEDLTRGMPIRYLIDRIVSDLGRLDILVNAAQVQHPAGVLEMDEWDWQRTMDVNLGSPFLLMQASARKMQSQGGGVIVNLAVDGIHGAPLSGMPAYYAGKSGLAALSRAAAHEFLPYNIRVYALCSDEFSLPENSDSTCGRPDRYEIISKLVTLLCSSQTAQLTSQIFRLDSV